MNVDVHPFDFDLEMAALVNRLRDMGIDGTGSLLADAQITALLRDARGVAA